MNPNVWTWIICDGDIDPEWIESLNSVLDDNKLLTLPNGERMLVENINFIFETRDISFASPATISRTGIICLGNNDYANALGFLSVWEKSLPETGPCRTHGWINKFVNPSITLVQNENDDMGITVMSLVKNCIGHLCSYNDETSFLRNVSRGLSCHLTNHKREYLTMKIMHLGSQPLSRNVKLIGHRYNQGLISIFDNDIRFVELKGKKSDVIVTRVFQNCLSLFLPYVNNCEPFMIIGPHGCGKSKVIKHAFSFQSQVVFATIHCNEYTKPNEVKGIIKKKCHLTSINGQTYSPINAKKLIILFKNIDKPGLDKYGTSMFAAFLQGFLNQHGFYDDNLGFVRVECVHVVATVSGIKNNVDKRLCAKMRMVVMENPEKEEMISFASAMLATRFLDVRPFEKIPREITSDKERMNYATFMINIFKTLPTTCSSKEIIFNHFPKISLRKIKLWSENLTKYDQTNFVSFLNCFINEAHRLIRDQLGYDASIVEFFLKMFLKLQIRVVLTKIFMF